MPLATPVTTPDALTVAIDGLPLDQVPPGKISLKVVVEPAQTVVVPIIAGGGVGSGLTVTEVVVYALPQALVTVYVIIAVPLLSVC